MSKVQDSEKLGVVMVLGAGIAGMQSALDLADSGYFVYLVDHSPCVGGLMARLDKTFPTNDCTMCIISPKLVEVGRHLNIEVIANTELESLEGEPGHFTATLLNHPRFIDPEKCTGCGQCSQVCPLSIPNEFNCGLDNKSVTSIRYPQAVPLVYSIDANACLGCGLCETVCLAKAVRYADEPRRTRIEVGAVVLATGTEVFDPSKLDTYAYSNLPNVVTSLEFERILSASGPYRGRLMRPYDREEPKKIAWLQCVGSRDLNQADKPYCSSVCCMYAIKEAVIAMEHAHGALDTAIFYMDIRSHGKDFERYYDRAREQGVRFVRSRVHSIVPTGDGDMELVYVDADGRQTSEKFNMVVLSVGLQAPGEMKELAKRLDIDVGLQGFVKTDSFHPTATSRPGVYVCGAVQGPKDIPQSVTEASAAAATAGKLLHEKRWSQTNQKQIAVETNVVGEPPRIGIFVCHCGINIGGVVDVPAVREYARTLPYVVYVEDNLYTCSQDTQVKMSQVIREQGINRVIVAACTPKTHEPLFQETLIDAGLNKYLFEMANIRNQNSWVHMHSPEAATLKAKTLVRMAVAKAALLEPLRETELDILPVTLVVGGGVAGMTAAKALADQGFQVHLLESSDVLGGNARSLYKTWRGEFVAEFVEQLATDVEQHPSIAVYKSAELLTVQGFVGNFTSQLKTADESKIEIHHGIAILATGGKEYKPVEYLYGRDPRVLTHLELDARIMAGDAPSNQSGATVFIQCVGSREPSHPYCSRVCCTHTMESALHLKRHNPDMPIYVLYRDIRTYGEREDLYTEARKEGIIFIRYEAEDKPKVEVSDGRLKVTLTEPILKRPVAVEADLLVLASAIEPSAAASLGQFFKVPVNEDGFFVEAHPKLRPVDFATEGVFVCGMAHCPKSLDESIAQALAAASRATCLLSNDKISVSANVAQTNQALCSACGTCVSICPYSAPGFNEKGRAEINPGLCKGCGLCAASCRSGAIRLLGFDDAQIFAMIETM
jgi:heterodisulfide reductase subunit A